MTDKLQAAENYLILLLGASPQQVPSKIHIQKEIFVLAQVKPLVDTIFRFQKHYFGPYSEVLAQVIEDQLYYPDAFEFNNSNIGLTKQGKAIFQKLVAEHGSDPAFNQLLVSLRLIRELYDRLTPDEVMFLIYASNPDYVSLSKKYEPLFKDSARKEAIVKSLYRKQAITEQRYAELMR